jgi:hypothetical protein
MRKLMVVIMVLLMIPMGCKYEYEYNTTNNYEIVEPETEPIENENILSENVVNENETTKPEDNKTTEPIINELVENEIESNFLFDKDLYNLVDDIKIPYTNNSVYSTWWFDDIYERIIIYKSAVYYYYDTDTFGEDLLINGEVNLYSVKVNGKTIYIITVKENNEYVIYTMFEINGNNLLILGNENNSKTFYKR